MILRKLQPPQVLLQILETTFLTSSNRLILTLSDGDLTFLFCELSDELLSSYSEEDLCPLTVIRIDDYEIRNSNHMTIVVNDLKIIHKAVDIGQIVGYPIITRKLTYKLNLYAENLIRNNYNQLSCDWIMEFVFGLRVKLENPILQVLSFKKFTVNSAVEYKILVSDGKSQRSSTVSAQVKSLITTGNLKEFAIFKVSSYLGSSKRYQQRELYLQSIQVIDNDFGKKIGNPIPCVPCVDTFVNQASKYVDKEIVNQEFKIKKIISGSNQPKLSFACLPDMLKGLTVTTPIIQILDGEKISEETYVLTVSDGIYFETSVILNTAFNELNYSDMKQFSVIAVNNYIVASKNQRWV